MEDNKPDVDAQSGNPNFDDGQAYPSPTPQRMLDLGWSIIPVCLDKKPLIPWKEFQTRLPTLEEITNWEETLHPAGWAVVTGEISGVIVFDFDGPKGAATMRKMGLQPHRQTPNDGFHVDRAWPGHHVPTLNAKSKKALNAKYPGMDIRGDGGYAVVAGSAFIRHPDGKTNGETRPYCWLINAGGELQMPREEWLRVDAIPARVGSDRLVRMALDRHNFSGRNDTGLWLACQLRDNNYCASEAADPPFTAAANNFMLAMPLPSRSSASTPALRSPL